MIKFIKKHKLNFISYLFCAFAMALFTIISFNCKTYAYTINEDGNIVGDNLFNIDWLSDNHAIDGTSGVYISYNDYRATEEYISITPNTNYSKSGNFTIFFYDSNKNYLGFNYYVPRETTSFTTPNNAYFYRCEVNNLTDIYFMLNYGDTTLPWEPYGVWYSETNYDTIDNLYNNTLNQYNDLALGNNYGYWKYIDYVEFEESNNIIFVPNTQEQNEWSTNDLINNNILKIGGYFDTTSLTMEPYQSNYNEVDSYISFNAYTPSESFIMTFGNCVGCNVVINDENSNSFSYTISETNYLIDINLIKQNVPSFGLYIIEMYISPNNAEQNGIYFANNDYITAYNKGYNVATSNADRKYIPQITDLQNQINSLDNKIIELTNNINTLTALNTDLQNQINNSYSWQTLFFAFADTPFRVVSNVLGFELFGLNLFATFIGMITVFGVVYLLKKFL